MTQWILHNSGLIADATETTTAGELTTFSGIGDQLDLTLQEITSEPNASGVVANHTDYLWSDIGGSTALKPFVKYSIPSPTIISPSASQAFNWTVTGTLPADFVEPTTSGILVSRQMTRAGDRGLEVSSPPKDDVAVSGTAASGTTFTFSPNGIPGHYDLSIFDNNSLWRDPRLRITASGVNNSSTISGTRSGSWFATQAGSTLTMHRAPEPDLTSLNGQIGLNLETGTLVMNPGANISLQNAAGISTEIDLVGADGALDIIASGTNAAINLRAAGIGSSINLVAESGTIVLDANEVITTANIVEDAVTDIFLFQNDTDVAITGSPGWAQFVESYIFEATITGTAVMNFSDVFSSTFTVSGAGDSLSLQYRYRFREFTHPNPTGVLAEILPFDDTISQIDGNGFNDFFTTPIKQVSFIVDANKNYGLDLFIQKNRTGTSFYNTATSQFRNTNVQIIKR